MTDQNQPPEDPIASELVHEDSSFADIVVQFVEGLNARVETMEDAILANDFDALRAAAHQLKGSGGGYGYPILTERAAEIEKGAKAQTMHDCRRALDELRSICERVIVAEEND